MTNEESIAQRYKTVGRMWGGELLLHPADALSFIDDCARSKLTIYGMEFFHQVDHDLLPDGIADFEDLLDRPDASEKSVEAARKLLRDRPSDSESWVTFAIGE